MKKSSAVVAAILMFLSGLLIGIWIDQQIHPDKPKTEANRENVTRISAADDVIPPIPRANLPAFNQFSSSKLNSHLSRVLYIKPTTGTYYSEFDYMTGGNGIVSLKGPGATLYFSAKGLDFEVVEGLKRLRFDKKGVAIVFDRAWISPESESFESIRYKVEQYLNRLQGEIERRNKHLDTWK